MIDDLTIMCGKCHKPIDRLSVSHDPQTDTMLYLAQCHGELEATNLTRLTIEDSYSIKGAVAFMPPAALGEKKDD
jgi:hypothetical protein